MKKIVFVLLFSFALLVSSTRSVYALDIDYEYSTYVDEVAGIDRPYWSFDYYPILSYSNKFLWFEWGKAETVGWNIDTVSFYFNMVNMHKGEFLVGYNPSDMDITFEFAYSSIDENLQKYNFSSSITYSLADIDFDNDYVEFVIPYQEVLSQCKYYEQGYETILKSVAVSISSRVLKKHGTVIQYDFYFDENYAKQIYTGIDYYKLTDADQLLVTTTAGSFKGDDDGLGDGNGGNVEKHYFVVIYPDSVQKDAFDINDIFTSLLVEFPRAIWNVLEFLFDFILLLPSYIHMVVPFLPEYIIAAIMFVIVFGIVWGIIVFLRSLKGA